MPSNPHLPLLSLLRLISGMKMQMAALLLCLLCSMFSAHVRSLPKNRTLPSEPFRMWTAIPQTSPSPAISPNCHGCSPSPSKSKSEHNHKHRHQWKPHAASPPPSSRTSAQVCDQITCSDPLTSAPTGSPCGCVFPIQVGLVLGVVVCTIYPKTTELETEIAAGTYLEQRQVRITRADADSQDQGKTIVHIDLVPLGEKFNRTTALLIYDRFWKKKVSINMTLVGDYEVKYVQYPGLPSSPPSLHGNRPPSERHQDPVSAAITSKRWKMNARSIAFIVLSSSVVFLTCIVAVVIYLKYLKPGSLPADSPFLISSIIKRAGKGIRHRLSSRRASSISPFLNSPRDACGFSVKRFSLAELEKATENFSSKKILGQGGFGRVYLGTMEDGSEVAVKLLTRKDQRGDREFAAEIEILSRLHHRNLVKLVGICIEKQTRCLVYELVRNGSVESHLHGADLRRGPLDWDARVKIALGAARGLAYLHEDSYPRVIHRDFKASNILLEEDFTPKVSDFGLAREASEGNEQISTQVMGTFGYVAPEYAMTGHLLVKSDVYSYGVVLLELLSGRKPVDMSQPQGQESLVVWARPLFSSKEGLEQLVDPSLGGNFNFDSMARVAAIASMCVNPEVSQRPFMGEVVQALKFIYDDMEETCEDPSSLRENSGPSVVPESSIWWNGGNHYLTHGLPSSIMMDYSSGSFDRIERPISISTLTGGGGSLTEYNGSGPLRTERDEVAFYRMRGSVSDNGLLVKHFGFKGYMV